MPDMARHATTAVQQSTIDRNPATDASAGGYIDEMSQAATSAIELETLLKVSSQAYQPYNFGLWPTKGKNFDPWLTAKSRNARAAGESARSVRLTTYQRRRIGRPLTSRQTSLPSATSAAMVWAEMSAIPISRHHRLLDGLVRTKLHAHLNGLDSSCRR